MTRRSRKENNGRATKKRRGGVLCCISGSGKLKRISVDRYIFGVPEP